MTRKSPPHTRATTKRVLDELEVPETYREKPKMGRPTTFTEELGAIVCKRVIEGENILAICGDEGMPSWSTLCGWRVRNPDFAAKYAQARAESAEALEAEALKVSRNAHDKDTAAAARVYADTLKWAASKRDPKRYSERTKVDVTATLTLEQLVQQAILPAPATPVIEGSATEIAVKEEDEE